MYVNEVTLLLAAVLTQTTHNTSFIHASHELVLNTSPQSLSFTLSARFSFHINIHLEQTVGYIYFFLSITNYQTLVLMFNHLYWLYSF